MNSYMRSPRNVTAQPIGMPLRILKFAMDFFARVMMAFCPVICPSSTAAVSNSLAFWLASPRPILTVTFFSLGTAIMFFQPKCFISAGTVSFRYRSCNRLFIAYPIQPLLVPIGAATLATAHLGAIRQNRVPNPRVLPATGADHHYVRHVDSSFLLHDAALDVLARVRPRVALHDGYVLDHHGVFLRVDGKHAAALAGIAPSNHAYLVTLAYADGVPLGSFVCQCHRLPNLRSQGNNLGKFLLAQLSGHGAKDARANRLAGVVDQHRGIIIEPYVGAVAAAALFAHPHDHRFHYRSLLHLAFRRGFLYGRGDDVAEAGFQSNVATDRQNAHQLPCAGIVRNSQPGSHLNHGCAPLSRLISALTSSEALRVSTSLSRQRFSLEIGREAIMRTVSPGLAWRCSSWA